MNTISILIPAYNSERTIADCIHSVKVQTQQPSFVMVVNDCSTDKTGEISESLGVYTKTNPKRIGKAASLNSAFEFIQTDYVLTLDSDTYLERDFIRKLLKVLDSHGYDAGSGMVNYIGKNKFSKAVAKRWCNRIWKYNGCCQFFKTDIIKELRFDECTYVEDEEIYQRTKSLKAKMVNAWAYTEVTQSKEQYMSQDLRWLRGDAQLALRNRSLSTLSAMTIFAVFPLILFSLVFYYIKTDPTISMGITLCLFLWGRIESNYSYNLKDIIRGMFLHTFVFIEIVILRSKFNVDNWKRETPISQ